MALRIIPSSHCALGKKRGLNNCIAKGSLLQTCSSLPVLGVKPCPQRFSKMESSVADPTSPEQAIHAATALQMKAQPALFDTSTMHLPLLNRDPLCCDLIFCQNGKQFSKGYKLINQVNPEMSNWCYCI